MLDKLELRKEPGIYIITNNVNGKVYVGESINIQRRLAFYGGCYSKRPIDLAIKKYGLKCFHFEVEYFPSFSKCDLLELEGELIKRFNCLVPNGYNICAIGKSMVGYKHTEETKNKIAFSKRRENLSKETIEKLSEVAKNRLFSDSTRKILSFNVSGEKNPMHGKSLPKKTLEKRSAKVIEDGTHKGISNGFYGKQHSEETRMKMREAAKNRVYNKRGPYKKKNPQPT